MLDTINVDYSNFNLPISNTSQKLLVSRKYGALESPFETILTETLQFILENFGHNKCWPFQIQSYRHQILAKNWFFVENIAHWNLNLILSLEKFYTSFFKILATINVRRFTFVISQKVHFRDQFSHFTLIEVKTAHFLNLTYFRRPKVRRLTFVISFQVAL